MLLFRAPKLTRVLRTLVFTSLGPFSPPIFTFRPEISGGASPHTPRRGLRPLSKPPFRLLFTVLFKKRTQKQRWLRFAQQLFGFSFLEPSCTAPFERNFVPQFRSRWGRLTDFVRSLIKCTVASRPVYGIGGAKAPQRGFAPPYSVAYKLAPLASFRDFVPPRCSFRSLISYAPLFSKHRSTMRLVLHPRTLR